MYKSQIFVDKRRKIGQKNYRYQYELIKCVTFTHK